MKFLDKLERKFGRSFGIHNLMLYIIFGNLIVFLANLMKVPIYNTIALYPQAVLQGEVWRLISFIFIPPSSSPIFFAFVLYFYYWIGSTLESHWGTFRFNLYYLTGIIGAIIGSFLTGQPATSQYLNLSLFIAFASIYPDLEVRIYFLLPVKIKWLAYISGGLMVLSLLTGSLSTKVMIIASIINLLLYFAPRLISNGKNQKRRKKFVQQSKVIHNVAFHKCTVCGITEKDDPNMQFRYCSKCSGTHEYCMDHLHNHEHR